MRSKGEIGILHYVWADNIHVLRLVSALNSSGLKVKKAKSRLNKVGLVILFSPLYPIVYKLSGYKILHVHWMRGAFRPQSPNGLAADKFFYAWYKLFMLMARLMKLRVVWTAHNFLPMEHLFEDNIAARRHLIGNCNAVIALSEAIMHRLSNELGAGNVTLIPAAEPDLLPTQSKAVTRNILGIQGNALLFSAIGHMQPYKGPDIFLKSILLQGTENKFVLSGAVDGSQFARDLIGLAHEVQESGHSLHTDFTFLADSDLANLIYATDFLVCPFRHISNSGFINLALAAGTPLILPDWASLDWVPRNCAIWYPAQGGPEALALAIQSASALDPSERESMSQSGKAFMASRSWDNYVLKHITLYRSL